MIVPVLIGIIIIKFIFSGVVIVITRNKIKKYKNKIKSLKTDVNMWDKTNARRIREIAKLKEEIKNLHIENDSINDQRNVEKSTYQLEHNQIEKIRKILES
jgi:phage shock protein A